MSQFYSGDNKSLLNKITDKNQLNLKEDSLDDDHVIAEFVVEMKNRNDFKIDRGSQSAGIKTLICKICNSDRFIVGQAEYFTAVKCIECGYELGIHEG